MKVLITGATGFIGRHLIEAFGPDGHDLGLLVRDPSRVAPQRGVTVIPGDLDDLRLGAAAIREFGPDTCVHLAWEGIPNYAWDVSSRNLRRSLGLIEFLLADTPCRKLVVTGSCMEYGRTQGPCVESDPAVPSSYFSWAKHALAAHLSMLANDSKLTSVWLRLFYVYGPGQRTDSLLPSAIRSMLRGEQPAIRNPFNAQDFVYVDDVVEAIRLAANHHVEAGIYNIGSGEATPVVEMCRLVETCLPGRVTVADALGRLPRPADATCFWADIAKARRGLGWAPRHSLAEGVRRHVAAIVEAESCSSTSH